MDEQKEIFTGPWLFAVAVLVFALAILEKGLNLIGTSIPGPRSSRVSSSTGP